MNLQLGQIYPQQREGHGAVRARPSRTGPVKVSRDGGEGPPGVGSASWRGTDVPEMRAMATAALAGMWLPR